MSFVLECFCICYHNFREAYRMSSGYAAWMYSLNLVADMWYYSLETSGMYESMHVVDTMSERKELMAARSDAFIALPGGMGTLDELFEVLSWNQLGLMNKPVSILNTDGFYDDMLSFLKRAEHDKFMREEHLRNLIVEDSPSRLISKLRSYTYHVAEKWVDRLKEMGY